jgi:hypothetical protein
VVLKIWWVRVRVGIGDVLYDGWGDLEVELGDSGVQK